MMPAAARRPRAVGVLAFGVLAFGAFAGGALAQDPATFDAAWQDYVTATDPASRQQAAHRASDAFLAMPEGRERTERLPRGVASCTAAERTTLALELAAEAWRAAQGTPSPDLVTAHLVALARAGELTRFVAMAKEQGDREPLAVTTALVAAEAWLLPLADAATRRGDAAGRYVFERLAAIEPVTSWRLANCALLLRHLGEVDDARALYERARALAPNDGTLENDYGLFLRATGDPAGALAAFRRGYDLDAAVPGGRKGEGPAVTNLLHHEVLHPGRVVPDPLPLGSAALALRPDAVMLRRLVLDLALNRLDPRRQAFATGSGAMVPAGTVR
jgi:tetratricopeptide (TPR) repeat protein